MTSMTTIIRSICLLSVACVVLARPFGEQQQSQVLRRNRNKLPDDSDVANYVSTRMQCESLNDCNGHGKCVTNYPKAGQATCDCEEKYFGDKCQIKPVESMRCFMDNNQGNQAHGATCPEGQFCMLDDMKCFFFNCAIAKGFCVPEPQFLQRADD